MKIGAKAGSRVYQVNVDRQNGSYIVEVDGERHVVDAQKLEANFYTILTDGRSYEVSIEADGDSYFVRHGAAGQRVTLSDPSRRGTGGLDSLPRSRGRPGYRRGGTVDGDRIGFRERRRPRQTGVSDSGRLRGVCPA